MALNEVLEEIKENARKRDDHVSPKENLPKSAKRSTAKKPMTKEEIEAYRQKMMEREEARYLGKSAKPAKPSAKRKAKLRKRANKVRMESEKAKSKKVKVKMPKTLQPMEPLCLLRVPGLPKGDCLAIYYARGADV